MIEWFTAPGSGPFTVALLVMLGLALTELLALLTGFSLGDAVDEFVVSHAELDTLGQAPTGMETTAGGDGHGTVGRFLAWLYVGKVPVLMLLIVFLTVFGLLGLSAQELLRAGFGAALPSVLAAPAVLLASLPIVRLCAGGLARIMPREESSAVDPSEFIGRTAVVVGGTARVGIPAQARLSDRHGTDHYVMVEPDNAGESFATGARVLLVRQTGGGRFTVIDTPNGALLDEKP